MAYLPLDLPPGLFANGTPYAGRGRWVEGRNVRWLEGALAPMGGWRRVFAYESGEDAPPLWPDPDDEAPRGAFRWRALNGTVWTAVGSNRGLYVVDQDGRSYDITPAGFVGQERLTGIAGYGIGLYGVDEYGVERRNALRDAASAAAWSFAAWGQDLIANFGGPASGRVYSWSPTLPVVEAALVPGSPTGVRGVAVTDQRILVTVGDSAEPRTVRWSDSEDREEWAAAATTQAGSITLSGSGNVRAIVRAGDVHIVLGDSDAHAMRYLGPPYIFGFRHIADNICLRAGSAAVSVGGRAYWWGRKTFWVSDGGSVQPLPCDVLDYVVNDADPDRYGLTQCWVSTCNREIWWHYASRQSATAENDRYVIYDYQRGVWNYGSADRSAGVGKSGPMTLPEWRVAPDGTLYEHDIVGLQLPEPAYVVSGPLELPRGDAVVRVTAVQPDTPTRPPGAAAGPDDPDATLTLLCRDSPNAPDRAYGPYALTRPTPVRAWGREVRARFDLPTARVLHGTARLDIQPGGRR